METELHSQNALGCNVLRFDFSCFAAFCTGCNIGATSLCTAQSHHRLTAPTVLPTCPSPRPPISTYLPHHSQPCTLPYSVHPAPCRCVHPGTQRQYIGPFYLKGPTHQPGCRAARVNTRAPPCLPPTTSRKPACLPYLTVNKCPCGPTWPAFASRRHLPNECHRWSGSVPPPGCFQPTCRAHHLSSTTARVTEKY